ncbi:MAG: hypothetical protein NTW82_06320 [Bacteroidia bacterium]|nr:hypothetical protein [Bacteroidia bacterium]
MKRIPVTAFILLLAIMISTDGYCQIIDSISFLMNSRLSFYSFENEAEMILHVPQNLIYNKIEVSVTSGSNELTTWKGMPGKKLLRIPFKFNLQPDDYKVIADITVSGRDSKYMASADLIILNYKPGEVKTDRLSGGLIVNKRQFFPFGFYCYSPVQPTLPEEEIVKGFNLISPYQKISPETFNERKAYMDRCAQLGMKVHYNLLSVSGGGGVSSKIDGISDEQKKELLINEVIAFRDHPALLAWYIADEPTGRDISPEVLEETYRTIREYDLWHPVTIVFMAPFLSSKLYSGALDIVMADPYPVPDMPVTFVGNITGQLSAEFAGSKPIWVVPQAFGGGEWWSREPSLQELRSMTYQAIIKGARGIQYFIRQGLNFFPKSTATWSECGRMAVEIAELTPWLLSDEETIPVRSVSQDIIVSSAVHNGQLMILAVNKTNAPQRAEYKISGMISGKARVLFENRSVSISAGYFTDQISSLGSQAYLIDIKPDKDTLKPYPGNLIKDPGFEDISSPGVPASCYARNGGDRGATYFLDSREHIEGNHSLRLVTPEENRGVRLRFFPVSVMNGRKYLISIWARSDPEQGLDGNESIKPREFEIALGESGSKKFAMESDWKKFVTIVTIPYDTDQPPRTNVILQMPSAGVAWFDMLQVIECDDIKQSINPELNYIEF